MFDVIIKNGTVVTATDYYRADVGIKDGKVAAIASELEGSAQSIIDATDKLLLPGGIEGHCHIAQESSSGLMTADDYQSGSISAAFGGNTMIVPFAAQLRGQSLTDVVDVYDDRAKTSVLDYSYHLIITDPSVGVAEQLPDVVKRGVTSFKVFMTYAIKVGDATLLDLMSAAKENGALTMVHAENNDLIQWTSDQLLKNGHTQPRYHAISHPVEAEAEAIHRVVALARYVDAPLMTVHVSTPEGADILAKARLEGAKIYTETCPQYLFLTRDDLDRENLEGAKYMCSPPVRDKQTQDRLWQHLIAGTFDFCSSDHAPYRFDETGKLYHGTDVTFKQIANGMPGIELRLPLLFSEGVNKGRMSIHQFVSLTSTNAAKTFGMFPQKGTIAVGSDADIAIWEPAKKQTVSVENQHDNMDYTPFEGWELTGWPTTVLSRGEVIVADGELKAPIGRGQFVARRRLDTTGKPGGLPLELDPARNFNADIAPKAFGE
ncbi:dihydropyrimidinase [Celerinatantimonas sp. MCCC 1A17872]|uniref:dihydropyrimidinase n=1 Tax=Celerinatantimonas sp. MCCC 1A17872 TaxID=3177514 RepID=UPI0038BE8667